MDRREVGLARNPKLRQRSDAAVAVDPARQLHDEHEPAAAIAADIGTRQLQRFDARERLAIAVGDPGPRGEHLVEPLELRKAQRAGDVRQPVVEPQPIVIEPPHVGRATLVSLGVDALLERRVGHRDDAALSGRHLLVRVEAEHRRMPARADR